MDRVWIEYNTKNSKKNYSIVCKSKRINLSGDELLNLSLSGLHIIQNADVMKKGFYIGGKDVSR